MATTLQVTIDDDGTPHAVLDDVARNKLRAALGVCVQVKMGEAGDSRSARNAQAAIVAIRGLLTPEAPADDEAEG